jgi:hypothetical protein
MSIEKISLELDADVAMAYNRAPAEEKKKIRSLLSMWLRETAAASPKTLPTIMDELSDRARKRGLTPSKLESLLRE